MTPPRLTGDTFASPRIRRSTLWLSIVLLGPGLVACGSDGGTEVVQVPSDQPTITAALDEVDEGGLILVSPGIYPESVTVDVAGVTIRGTDRDEVIIDGEDERIDGVRVIADGVRLQNFTVVNAVANGVMINGADSSAAGDEYATADAEDVPLLDRFEVSNVTASNNGLYGIYAFHSSNGAIRDTYTSGSSDAGLYVGQCDECNIVVENNVAERNAVGFENANASGVQVVGNRLVGNRVGLTLTTNYEEAFVPQRANVVIGNLIAGNREAETPEQAQGGFGIGIGLAGAQANQIVRNRLLDNPGGGVVLSNVEDVATSGNTLVANVFEESPYEVVDVAALRTRSTDNCRIDDVGGELPTDLGTDLCRTSNQLSADAETPSIEVPPGIPYFEVVAGPEQPDWIGSLDTIPDPLPARPADVDLQSIVTPDRSLLADRSSVSVSRRG